MARDATPTRCERVDGELELLSDPKRRSHAGSIGAGRLYSGSGSRSARGRRRRGREHAEAGRGGRREPEAAVALRVGEGSERDGGERAAAEQRRRHQGHGLAGARGARDLAGDHVEHAVEAERAEAEHDERHDADGGAVGPDDPRQQGSAAGEDADVAQGGDAPPASAAVGEPPPADARDHRADAHEREQQAAVSPLLAPPSRSAGTANVSTAVSADDVADGDDQQACGMPGAR